MPSGGHCGHIYEKVHKNTPFVRLIPLYERAAIPLLAKPATRHQAKGEPILFDRHFVTQ